MYLRVFKDRMGVFMVDRVFVVGGNDARFCVVEYGVDICVRYTNF